MEYMQLQTFVFVLMSICGGVVAFAAAIAVVVKFWKWAHKDTDKNTEDIETLKESYEEDIKALKAEYEADIEKLRESYEEEKQDYLKWFAADKRRIGNLERDFDEISEQNFLLMKANVAIMDHLLDGNNVDEMKSARDDVDKYLFDNIKKKRRETK